MDSGIINFICNLMKILALILLVSKASTLLFSVLKRPQIILQKSEALQKNLSFDFFVLIKMHTFNSLLNNWKKSIVLSLLHIFKWCESPVLLVHDSVCKETHEVHFLSKFLKNPYKTWKVFLNQERLGSTSWLKNTNLSVYLKKIGKN